MTRLLRIDASARREGSRSRALLDALEVRLAPAEIVRRDLADGTPLIDASWIAARDMPAEARGAAEWSALAWSDAAIAELEAADTVAIGLPVYNFGPPAALKAWIDQIARPRVTFRYTSSGPVGLLKGKRAFVAFAAGGTRFGSQVDFASGYMRHVLGFVGIDDVRFVLDDGDLPLDAAV
jgi:FMN-dependent NADH-azoreductase